MESEEPKQYPKSVKTFRRSKHEISVLARFYIAIGLYFAGCMLLAALVVITKDGMKALDDSIPFVIGFASVFSLIISLDHKGSLVETVRIDYIKQKIKVFRYDLLGRQHIVEIPFVGFVWDVQREFRRTSRLRLFPLVGKRIVICEGELGWTIEDCHKLESALSVIVDEDHFLNPKPSGQW